MIYSPVWQRREGRFVVLGRVSRGFTLIEVMVVVVILGLLAAMVVPKIMSRPGEAKRARAAVDIRAISQAIELYRLDNDRYPTTEQGLSALVQKPEIEPIPKHWNTQGYLAKVPNDPWGNPYLYLSPGLEAEYDIVSYGADAAAGGVSENADIVSWELEG